MSCIGNCFFIHTNLVMYRKLYYLYMLLSRCIKEDVYAFAMFLAMGESLSSSFIFSSAMSLKSSDNLMSDTSCVQYALAFFIAGIQTSKVSLVGMGGDNLRGTISPLTGAYNIGSTS